MTPQGRPDFLEPGRYRLRRLLDAAIVVPVVGLVLWLFPIVRAPASSEELDTVWGIIYLFVVWIGLIAVSFYLSRGIKRAEKAFEPSSASES